MPKDPNKPRRRRTTPGESRVFRPQYRDRTGILRDAAKYYVEVTDHRGKRRKIPGYTDVTATKELGRRVLRLVTCRQSGAAIDPELSRWIESLGTDTKSRLAEIGLIDSARLAGSRPLAELVADFERSLQARGRATETLASLIPRVRTVFEGIGATFWTDIRAERVERFLHERRESGWSVQASNHTLAAVRQFCRWAVASGIASEDPIRTLRKLNAETDRRRVRRALSSEEIRVLLGSAASGPVRDGMEGSERVLLYRVAVETGIRRKELMRLRVGSFDLSPGRAVLNLRADGTKSRKAATLPLREDLADGLRSFLRARHPAEPAFHLPKFWRAAETLQADLAAAGVPIADAEGHVADFHALRHAFMTHLSRTGAAPRVAQALARHSDVRLTLQTYTHLGANDERDAVESLPRWIEPTSTADSQRATGTNDGSSWRSAWRSEVDNPASAEIAGDAGSRSKGREGRSVVRPAGFEPATVGSEDRSSSN